MVRSATLRGLGLKPGPTQRGEARTTSRCRPSATRRAWRLSPQAARSEASHQAGLKTRVTRSSVLPLVWANSTSPAASPGPSSRWRGTKPAGKCSRSSRLVSAGSAA